MTSIVTLPHLVVAEIIKHGEFHIASRHQGGFAAFVILPQFGVGHGDTPEAAIADLESDLQRRENNA